MKIDLNISKNINLISIDLDGTLLDDSKQTSLEDISTLLECKKRGYILVFNTARPMKIVPKELYEIFQDDYWILSNGTTIFKNGKKIYDKFLFPHDLIEVVEWLLEKDKDFFSFESEGQIYSLIENSSINKKYFASQTNMDEFFKWKINKLLIISELRNFPIHEINSVINEKIRMIITEEGKYIQIMPTGISKLSAIEVLCDLNDITIQNVLAFGDDINDIELLTNAGIGVAMENANEHLLEILQYKTLSNIENGVSNFINKFLMLR